MKLPSANQRRRPTRRETRERLLRAAEGVFAERGLDAASLDDVAFAAGLTKGAVYSNFRSKDELVLALMEGRIAERTQEAVATLVAARGSDGGVRDAGAGLLDAVRADAAWQRLFLEYWARAVRDPDLRERLALRRQELRNVISAALKEAARDGSVALPLPADDLAVVILALSNGLAVEEQIDPDAVADGLFGDVLAILAR